MMKAGDLQLSVWVFGIVALGWMSSGRLEASEMQATSAALVRMDRPSGWNVGVMLETGSRTVAPPGPSIKMNTRGAMIRVGYRIQPPIHVWGELGASQADRKGRAGTEGTEGTEGQEVSDWYEDDASGETAFAWGMGTGIALVEFPIRSSPVLGMRESLTIELNASYRVRRSDIPRTHRMIWDPAQQVHVSAPGGGGSSISDEFIWSETQVSPLVVYRRNLFAESNQPVFSPTGYAVRGGPGYVRTRYDLGEMNVEDSNSLGLLAGVDVRLQNGWVCQLNSLWINGSDREFSLVVIRYF